MRDQGRSEGLKPQTEQSPSLIEMDTLEEKRSDVFGSILARLDRVEEGNFGDSGHVGKGVWELRIDLGLGYRVYFGEDGDFVILLLGGSKKTQSADINQAQEFWSDYNA
ncbi:MAG: type II toxin-antitoxin system RelE/ParE family toxin [Bryobacteraceae bacterium]